MNEQQLEGYKLCMKEFEGYLHDSMTRNGGCKTPGQAWDVLNDVAYFTHKQALRIQQLQQPKVYIVMGGM